MRKPDQLADRLVAHCDTACEHQLLNFTKARREPEVQPHAVDDDLDRVATAPVSAALRCSPRRFSQVAHTHQRDSATDMNPGEDEDEWSLMHCCPDEPLVEARPENPL
ncbi:MAG: hypothetical protein K0U84_14740 [Actinomycetia bacterium]|nr:hypothetical protein [Actinomycetes bacterium]